MTSTVPSGARIFSGMKQQLKIIQAGETGVAGAVTATTTAIGQRTTLLSPLPISVPIVSQSAISSYVQTRYMRPVLHISQGSSSGQGAQQVVITTSQASSGPENSVSTATTKIRCLPALTVTKRERPARPAEDQKRTPKREEHVDRSTLEQLREFDLVLEQVKERSTTSSTSSSSSSSASAQTSATAVQPTTKVVEGTDATCQTETAAPRKCSIRIETEAHSHGNSLTGHARLFTSSTRAPLAIEKRSPGGELLQSTQATQTKHPTTMTTATTAASIGKGTILTGGGQLKTGQKSICVGGGTTVISPTSAAAAAAAAAAAYTQKISKPQEDEQTVQRIYDILAEYAEQLRNSPDLNNKPAPRRRSNPLNSSCTANGKKRKTLTQKPSDGSGGTFGDFEQAIDSEDSSCGTSSLYNQSPLHDSSTSIDSSNQFLTRHQQQTQTQTQQTTPSASSVKSEIEIEDVATTMSQSQKISTGPQQQQSVNVLNFDLANQTPTNRAAVLVPGKYLVPLTAIKSGEFLEAKETIKKFGTSPGGQPQIVYKTRPVKIADTLTHQRGSFRPIATQNARPPTRGIFSAQRKSTEQNCAVNKAEGNGSKASIVFQTHPGGGGNFANLGRAVHRNNLKIISVQQSAAGGGVGHEIREEFKEESRQMVQETSVITKAENQNQNSREDDHKLHVPLHSSGEAGGNKIRNNLRLDSGQSTTSKILRQLTEGRKLAMERELKFQESRLPEECEDLGVDEPSASDLFPEAELLFEPETSSQDDEIPRDFGDRAPTRGQLTSNGSALGEFAAKNDIPRGAESSSLRLASLREVIGWDSAEAPTEAAKTNPSNFIIQHTSGDPFKKSPSWSPAGDLFNSDASPREEEGKGASVATVSRKRRLSSRGPAARKNNCPCYAPHATAAPASASSPATIVLNSSTQTPATGAPGSARSARIRTVKGTTMELKFQRTQRPADAVAIVDQPPQQGPSQGQQTTPPKRGPISVRLAKVSRR